MELGKEKMKFSCSRDAFDRAMTLLLTAVPFHSPKEILKCILLESVEENKVILSATDFEIWISYSLPVDGLEGAGSILLPADKMAGIAHGEWNSTFSVTIENNVAEITAQYNKYRLFGYANPDEFPKISEESSSVEVIVNGDDLANALQKTCFAAAHTDTRFAMNGVLFHIEKDQIEFVASDTHRLSWVRKKLMNKSQVSKEAIVINKGASIISKAAEGEGEIKLQLSERDLRFESQNKLIISRLVEGKFPKYQDVIPNCANTLVIAREPFFRALRLLSSIAPEERKIVVIEICPNENKIIISSIDTHANAGTNTLTAEEIKGNEVRLGFNCNYFLDVLRVMNDEKVVLRYHDEKTAVRLDAEDFVHVIMPVRM